MNDFFPEDTTRQSAPNIPASIAWLAPPLNWVPGLLPTAIVIGKSEKACILLMGLQCFPMGVQVSIRLRVAPEANLLNLGDELFDDERLRTNLPGRLKWGLELPNGARITNVDPPSYLAGLDAVNAPDGPMLTGMSGTADLESANRDFWLWPLPPAGPLKIACEWKDAGIPFAIHDIDSESVQMAANNAFPIWG